MADDRHVLRGIDWRESFNFTHIFRAFRISVHPSKLLLGLLFLLTFFIGGKLLDWCWATKHRAVAGEIEISQMSDRSDQAARRTIARQMAIDEYARLLTRWELKDGDHSALETARAGRLQGKLKDKIAEVRDSEMIAAAKLRDENIKQADELVEKSTDTNRSEMRARRDNAVRSSHDAYRARRTAIFAEAADNLRVVENVNGQGIFTTFFNYETAQFDNIVKGVLGWNWLSSPTVGAPAVLPSLWNFVAVGPTWLIRDHFLFFILLTILFLGTWAYFGGAIARIAAVHVARDEKLSLQAGLKFSGSKLLSFACAPLIPLVIVLVLWALIWLLGLVGNVPGVGPVIVGLLFFLVLIAAGAMAMMLIGLIGGFNLMYPTIAVEGTDSFDAIGASFSYLFARPWRLLFYTLVALVYGAITYIFVRFFVYLMLALAHGALGSGLWADAASGEALVNAMWARPSLETLTSSINTWQLGAGQTAGAYLINLWVYVAAAFVGAYAISFYFSVHTIIYYLLRREVDATEMDDVLIEEPEDDFVDSAEPSATAETVVAATTVVAVAPVVEDVSTPGGNVAESPVPSPDNAGEGSASSEEGTSSDVSQGTDEERPSEDRPAGQ